MLVGERVDQLDIHPDTMRVSQYAAFQHVKIPGLTHLI
jgi:hypothetical protein